MLCPAWNSGFYTGFWSWVMLCFCQTLTSYSSKTPFPTFTETQMWKEWLMAGITERLTVILSVQFDTQLASWYRFSQAYNTLGVATSWHSLPTIPFCRCMNWFNESDIRVHMSLIEIFCRLDCLPVRLRAWLSWTSSVGSSRKLWDWHCLSSRLPIGLADYNLLQQRVRLRDHPMIRSSVGSNGSKLNWILSIRKIICGPVR